MCACALAPTVPGGLTSSQDRPPILPSSFRGTVLQGEEAAERASLVSGPFRFAPSTYLVPEDVGELMALLRQAWESGSAITPRGGGTAMPGSNLGPGIVLELGEPFSSITWIDPEAGRIRAGAGAVADDLASVAAGVGRFLPFLPSSSRWCRVGGMVSTNSAGARTFRYGSAASCIDVVEGIFAWGEPFRVGSELPLPEPFARLLETLRSTLSDDLPRWPDLRKNSSGYGLDRFLTDGDPAQLLAGSEGTLAVLTHVEFTLPRTPLRRGLAILPAHSYEEVQEIALTAARLGTETCEILGKRFIDIAGLRNDPDVGSLTMNSCGLLLLEVAGETEDEVAEALLRIGDAGERIAGRGIGTGDPGTCERLWKLRHAASPVIAREAGAGRISTQFIEDPVVPPRRLAELLDGIDRVLADARFDAVVFGHAGDGNIHINPLLDVHSSDWRERALGVMQETTELVRSLGGTLSGEHGDGRIRAPWLPEIWEPPFVDAFRKVKSTLDPRGILNPGVILPLPGQDPFDGFTPRPRAYPPSGTPV